MKTIDSIQPPSPPPRPPASSRHEDRPKITMTGARFTKLKATPKRRRVAWALLATIVASPLLFVLALLGGYGLLVIIAYGGLALLMKISSRYTLVLALLALVYMVGSQLAAAADLAQALALLAYVLLAIGAISLAREVKSARRMWFKKH